MSKKNNSTESFVVFGTAFPETTEKDRRAGRSDAGQFVPLWKQEARDEQGRRRFHGAFTGGFSAGYFNTVGSKEGWEPSNFVSSRSARTERKEARPEDYMDEEDLEDMRGLKKLAATEEFDILGGTEREITARRKLEAEEGNRNGGLDLLGSSLMDMFGPPKDSIGVKLLRKMGWRPGQGIGPRTKKYLHDEDSDDENMNDITFAPRDTPIENFQVKRDTYGLGYDLVSLVPEVAEMKRLRELAREKEMSGSAVDAKNRSSFGIFNEGSGAFGLGVFDENDGEDDDVYGSSQPSMKSYHHSLYDDNEGGFTRDEIRSQAIKRKKDQEKNAKSVNNKLKCSDGRLPLKGFMVSNQKQQIGKWYAPPSVPAGFTGQHISSSNTPKASKITNENLFSFEERGNVLGEKAIETRSVFDYMPKHSKDKLDQAVGFFIDLGKDKSQLSDFPSIPKDIANLALQGFMPFGENPKKQARYRSYLENQAGQLTEDGIPKTVLPIPDGLTYEAGMKEMDEFAKAARIFRPISAMMSGRFTSASETSKNIEVVSFEGGLKTEEQYRKEKEAISKSLPEPKKNQLSQEAEAAAMKMFGNLTRTVKPFYPNRLVCKRFNVRNPHPNHDPTADIDAGRTQAGSKEALSKESMESMLNERLPLKFTSSSIEEPRSNDPLLNAVIPKPSDRKSDAETAPTTGVEKDIATKQNKEDEDEGPELDYERPSMDIFKAIFDDSDESDEEYEEGKDKQEDNGPRELVTSSVMNNEDEDFIGPPVPPSAATIDIPLEKKETSDISIEPFRPMFKRVSQRKEDAAPLTNIISEEVVVQPFKSRSVGHKRRHVSVSDDEDDAKERKRERSRSRHHRSSRHRKSSRRSRSREPEDKSREERRSRSDKSKSSRKRSRSVDDRKHRSSKKSSRKDKSKHRSSKEEEYDYDAIWVEKDPVIPPPSQTSNGKNKKEGRMSAADMWS